MQLKSDVEAELKFDPMVNAVQIGVTVESGAVTLRGVVDTYPDKWAAEDATKRVSGVRAVAQDLSVKVLSAHARSDSEIATAVQNALKWDVCVPSTVSAKIEKGVVTLEGETVWNYQRDASERAVRFLTGVTAIHNFIRLTPHVSAVEVKANVRAALDRQAAKDAATIQVDTLGSVVTLTGYASSWQSIEDAAAAAWAAPGVTEVVDHVKRHMTI